jgi:aminoglycoside phosphotransferase (APT) family kinase protein
VPVHDDDPLPIAHALRRRLDGWLARAAGLVPDATLAAIDHRFGDGSAFQGDRRVLCHRDFAPRNWLVANENFTLIDFEHSAPDHPLVDVVRLCDEVFADRPDLESAFFTGYGARPDADQLSRLLALHALATTTWGRRHHDAQFIARGDALLARLGLVTDPNR